MKLKWWAAAAACGLSLVLGTAWFVRAQSAAQALSTLELVDLTGRQHTLAEWRGKPVVVNFWASWCAPCLDELPVLQRMAAAQRGKVEFVGVAMDKPDALARYLQRSPLNYPVLLPADYEQAMAVLAASGNATRSLPFSVLLSEDGHVRWTRLGRMDAAQSFNPD